MLLAPLESVFNRNIAASSAARAACKRLDGKTFAVHVAGTPQSALLSLYFSCKDERIFIATKSDAKAAASLSGSPLAYLGMVGAQPESAMRGGGVHIEGDAEVAQAFRDLMKAAQPDVEEELSRVVGDVAAHQLGNVARGVLRFGRRAADTFAQNLSEYLQEESRDVVTRVEVDEFVASVDKIREDVDRTEARIALLSRQFGKR